MQKYPQGKLLKITLCSPGEGYEQTYKMYSGFHNNKAATT